MAPHHRTYRFAVLALLALAACGGDGAGLAPDAAAAEDLGVGRNGRVDLRAARDELLAADRAYSAASASLSFVDGLVNTLADDVRYLPAGGPIVRGREAVRALLASNPNNALSTYTWTPIRVDVASDGSLGYTFGYYQLQIPPVNGAPARTSIGKYVAMWRRGTDGWKAVALVRNPRPAGPVSETPPAGFESPDSRTYRRFPNHDPAATLEGMMDTDRAFSAAGEAPGALPGAFAAFAAPDGAVNGGGPEFVFGADAIRRDVVAPDSSISFTWAPVEGAVAGSADLGWTIGVAPVRERATGAILGYSKYLSVWKRQPRGEWRFVMDAGSGMPVP
jgi:ketosteroid isomerase-like protein